jgi:hypothetical protein
MPGFLGNAYGTDYVREILEHGVIARAVGEEFNVAAVRSHRGVIDSVCSDVDESSASYVEQ